ncbi:Serum response factor-binding protein 1 [Dissostichus eleginoides]|uniref:Serum response factor-binding protein 1 n=1 Tax=Dissostichus eleginoides TaxID=100907 RepID=A0AAD9BFQ0_DISEL|nr:Serum response factor-binding protein 1 [Dissostichus eleginoides]
MEDNFTIKQLLSREEVETLEDGGVSAPSRGGKMGVRRKRSAGALRSCWTEEIGNISPGQREFGHFNSWTRRLLQPDLFRPFHCVFKEPRFLPHVLNGGIQLQPHVTDTVEQGVVEQGAVEQGAVEQDAVEQGAVEQGAVEQGAVEQDAVEQGAVDPIAENNQTNANKEEQG